MEFQQRFAAEAACWEYLAACRWPDGFACPACGARRAWVLERRHLWQCADCHAQTSVTAGTVMHGTRTPLRLWFWAAYLVATHDPGISAKQLQRQLGLSRYETAWLILQKLRRAMIAPEREPLGDQVEVDEFYLGGLEEGRKGGRQRGKKTLVGVAIEVRGAGSGRVRLQVLSDACAQSLIRS
jgi:Transposase zinc-ribbon domain/ISXO2-like transposase domain